VINLTDKKYILWDVKSRTEKRGKPLSEGFYVHNGHGAPFCVLQGRFLFGRSVPVTGQSAGVILHFSQLPVDFPADCAESLRKLANLPETFAVELLS